MLNEEPIDPQMASEPATVEVGGVDRSSPPGTETRQATRVVVGPRFVLFPRGRVQHMNMNYAKSINGLLKIVQVVLFIVLFVFAVWSVAHGEGKQWTAFGAWTFFCLSIGFWMAHVVFPHLTALNEATKEGLIFVELMAYVLGTLIFIIGFILMLFSFLDYGYISALITTILCVLAAILCGFETFLHFSEWRQETDSKPVVVDSQNLP